jgi:hypothetical protein
MHKLPTRGIFSYPFPLDGPFHALAMAIAGDRREAPALPSSLAVRTL